MEFWMALSNSKGARPLTWDSTGWRTELNKVSLKFTGQLEMRTGLTISLSTTVQPTTRSWDHVTWRSRTVQQTSKGVLDGSSASWGRALGLILSPDWGPQSAQTKNCEGAEQPGSCSLCGGSHPEPHVAKHMLSSLENNNTRTLCIIRNHSTFKLFFYSKHTTFEETLSTLSVWIRCIWIGWNIYTFWIRFTFWNSWNSAL